MQTFDEIMRADVAEKPAVTQAQRRLLESRYDLTPRLDPTARMSRGKPSPVGPTAKLPSGVTWERLAGMTPDEIKSRGLFPYPSLPHPKHATGGQVFPQVQIAVFPRLERFDVEFDLPEAFLPVSGVAFSIDHTGPSGTIGMAALLGAPAVLTGRPDPASNRPRR